MSLAQDKYCRLDGRTLNFLESNSSNKFKKLRLTKQKPYNNVKLKYKSYKNKVTRLIKSDIDKE